MSIFNEIQARKPKSNTFDLSHDRKQSMDIGTLTPFLCMECVPGDNMKINTSQMIRFSPLVAPIMHQISVYTHFFFVPNRLVWSNWEDFITGGEDGTADPEFPYTTEGHDLASIGDYLGMPTQVLTSAPHSAIPFAAYHKIWNDYYRDQNQQTELDTNLDDGDNSVSHADLFNTLHKRAWQHDYFTSALPWTQKGAEATIPIGGTADINYVSGGPASIWENLNGPFIATANNDIEANAIAASEFADAQVDVGAGVRFNVALDNSANLEADLTTATAATINELRQAFRLQEWLEKNARGGTRYIESILSHFGVKSSDARLQRPHFIGGSSTPVVISEVLQTSATDSLVTPQGNQSGHAISVGGNKGISYYAEEHGYLIGIMSVMPKTAYQDGIPKHFMKFDKFDYFWPSFAHLGEQPIYNYEVYAEQDGSEDDIFGYIPRYSEYKFINSSVHGDFADNLDYWHAGRKFSTRPNLNSDFIECDKEEVSRIFAVTDPNENNLYTHVYNQIKAKRLMPYFGTPNF